ncbi:DUF456 domain-containing protein [Sporohalobacter salinus]|uniref:DUF456 domain-containing protein n=1 Tax=Sporohalobacter salinus TaxID=1494606 RepID=UPI0019615079|nr:DUF456 domain-containing protein [Sporohalobacter salinus]MBM7623219.1 uncharacterized protein YqgC (DUF456 family) [Sporohalobacter salinus]
MSKVLVTTAVIIGVLGTLLPGLPGTPIILIASIIYGWINGFQVISLQLVFGLVILSLLAELLEYILSSFSAKKFGASNYSIIGLFVGGLIGVVILGPLGILIGMFLGSIIVELIVGREFNLAIKTGLGVLVGAISGSIFSFLIALLMAGLLLSRVF